MWLRPREKAPALVQSHYLADLDLLPGCPQDVCLIFILISAVGAVHLNYYCSAERGSNIANITLKIRYLCVCVYLPTHINMHVRVYTQKWSNAGLLVFFEK